MTREEEIIKTAKFIYSPSSGIPQSLPMRVGFIEGAKWADKTMIDKICDWLLNNAQSYMKVIGSNYYYDSIGLTKNLRQIMEE